MIVMKFGGTSLESAAALTQVVSIIQKRIEQRPVVVVSAMGKTTNRLLALAGRAARGERDDALRALADLQDYHRREALPVVGPEYGPVLDGHLEHHFRELSELVKGLAVLGELTPRATDAIASYGERLSSMILPFALSHAGLVGEFFDARGLIVTDNRHLSAAPLYPETYARLQAALSHVRPRHVPVLGGFIGATVEGVTTTLGRGGSDFTAAIVGAGIGAEEVQIWTDVDGMLTVDPRVLSGGHRVRTLSFAEAAELAYFGAKVLHPSTVLPAMERDIPVVILNSRRPEVEGTRIVAEAVPCRNVVKSIACKRGITLLNVHSTRMLMATGFLLRIFEVFARYETPVDLIATSEVSVSLTVDQIESLETICRELREFSDVTVSGQQAIVSLVGDGLRGQRGLVGRVFQAVADVEVRLVSLGASLLNLSFVVAEADLANVVCSLHAEFFADLDPAMFD